MIWKGNTPDPRAEVWFSEKIDFKWVKMQILVFFNAPLFTKFPPFFIFVQKFVAFLTLPQKNWEQNLQNSVRFSTTSDFADRLPVAYSEMDQDIDNRKMACNYYLSRLMT